MHSFAIERNSAGHNILSYSTQNTKLNLICRKPENNSWLRQKNNKEIIKNHKGTRIFKDGEDLRHADRRDN